MKARVLLLVVLAAVAACIAGAPAEGRAKDAGKTAPEKTSRAGAVVLDRFESLKAWSAHPSDGTRLEIHPDAGFRGHSMRLDFQFLKGAGYVIARRALDVTLPENYVFTFRVRGDAPPEQLEFKLIDSTGANVWWSVRRSVDWPKDWQTFRVKKRQITFAWGPAGGGELRRPAALEIAVTAGSGGQGSVWFDDLELTELPPPEAVPPAPVVSASSYEARHEARRACDHVPESTWQSRPHEGAPWIALDFRSAREYSGLSIDWGEGRQASDYDVETSEDGRIWSVLRSVKGSNGGRDDLFLPDSESRHLRIRVRRALAENVEIREITVRPLDWAPSREAFYEQIAKEAPRGCYPRSFSGEQVYWTVVGVDADSEEGLLSEDGAFEVGRGAFTIEPFLFVDGKLVTWSDVKAEQSLAFDTLPFPTVRWLVADGLTLRISATALGDPSLSSALLLYSVTGPGGRRGTLYLAIRPFQVNPPTQFLNLQGGTARIERIAADGGFVRVDSRRIVSIPAPDSAGAVIFDGGNLVTEFLSKGRLPASHSVVDAFGGASAVLAYSFDLNGLDSRRDVRVLIPLHRDSPLPDPADSSVVEWLNRSDGQSHDFWSKTRTATRHLFLPEEAQRLGDILQTQVNDVLINRSGPAIQPGTRSYARSWIRDGALTCSVLLRSGLPGPVREFIEWFAPNQFANGKIPCVVDSRGPDPVPENDSNGEFIGLVTEYYRYTKDRAFAEGMWPRVAAAAAYLDSLRRETRAPGDSAGDHRAFFGLLPESISHEGYSAKPMHSYWDDFFALKGFRDAAYLAGALGRVEEARRWAAARDEFQRDLGASIDEAMAKHAIGYIPGCAELGDFDATSTAIGISPLGLEDMLPPDALRRTFDKYMEFFRARRDGAPWEAFTPYETRIIGSLVRMGRPSDAHELLKWFLEFQRPPGWNQWAEVVWKDERAPHFIGDMPHTWVGTEFARSVLDMMAFERDADSTLVLMAGVPLDWAKDGMKVAALPTSAGPLSYETGETAEGLTVQIEPGIRVPKGGILVHAPFDAAVLSATLDGRRANVLPGGVVLVKKVPATIVFKI